MNHVMMFFGKNGLPLLQQAKKNISCVAPNDLSQGRLVLLFLFIYLFQLYFAR